jgi:hypothetical protein
MDPNEIRARGIRRDIFARHGLEEGASDEAAIQHIMAKAKEAGAGPAGWANPEERANARAEYAKVGSTPDEVQKRWEESIYLVDPATHEFNQRYLRDKEFLERMTGDVGSAVTAWDKTNNNPLYRNNWRDSGGWKAQEGVVPALVNAATNPDLAGGQMLNMSNVPYDFLAMQGSGESPSAGLSLQTALGGYRSATNNRQFSQAPILDLPSSASPAERAARLRALQEETSTAAVPESGERWMRTTGLLPPPVVRDTGDAVLATLDGTQLIPGATLAKAPVKGAVKSLGKRMATDMATDATVSSGLMAFLGSKPDRTWSQYLGFSGEGEVPMKTPSEVDAANEARSQQYERTQQAAGVSTADAEAYKRLQQSGLAPLRRP